MDVEACAHALLQTSLYVNATSVSATNLTRHSHERGTSYADHHIHFFASSQIGEGIIVSGIVILVLGLTLMLLLHSHGPERMKNEEVELPWITVCLVVLLCTGARDFITSNLPTIGRDLQALPQVVNLSMELNWIAAAIFSLLFGFLACLGRRPLILLSFLIFYFSSIAAALAPNVLWLIVLRVVQGMGEAGLAVTEIVVADVYRENADERALAFARIGMMLGLGSVGAPLVGGLLAYVAGWRDIFLYLALCVMVVGCGIKLYLPETKEIGSVKVDMKPKPSPESMYSLASSTSAAFLEDARPFAYLLMNIGVESTCFSFLTNLAWILQLEKPSGYGVAPLNSNVLCCTIMPAYLVASFASLRAGSNASVCLRIGISLSLLVGICWMVFAHVIQDSLLLFMLSGILLFAGFGLSNGALGLITSSPCRVSRLALAWPNSSSPACLR